MLNDIYYTAIDIGTSKVCTVVARVGPEGQLKIVGVRTAIFLNLNKLNAFIAAVIGVVIYAFGLDFLISA